MTHPQKRTVMEWLRDIFPDVFGKQPDPPVVMTEWGPVTESFRFQGAMNMRNDPNKKAEVEELLIKQCGSVEAGMAKARWQFPEAYED